MRTRSASETKNKGTWSKPWQLPRKGLRFLISRVSPEKLCQPSQHQYWIAGETFSERDFAFQLISMAVTQFLSTRKWTGNDFSVGNQTEGNKKFRKEIRVVVETVCKVETLLHLRCSPETPENCLRHDSPLEDYETVNSRCDLSLPPAVCPIH